MQSLHKMLFLGVIAVFTLNATAEFQKATYQIVAIQGNSYRMGPVLHFKVCPNEDEYDIADCQDLGHEGGYTQQELTQSKYGTQRRASSWGAAKGAAIGLGISLAVAIPVIVWTPATIVVGGYFYLVGQTLGVSTATAGLYGSFALMAGAAAVGGIVEYQKAGAPFDNLTESVEVATVATEEQVLALQAMLQMVDDNGWVLRNTNDGEFAIPNLQ